MIIHSHSLNHFNFTELHDYSDYVHVNFELCHFV